MMEYSYQQLKRSQWFTFLPVQVVHQNSTRKSWRSTAALPNKRGWGQKYLSVNLLLHHPQISELIF